jgi:hypothetical protein
MSAPGGGSAVVDGRTGFVCGTGSKGGDRRGGEGTTRQRTKCASPMLLVEQTVQHALAPVDRGYVLVNGRIVMSKTGPDLLADPNLRKAYLGG